MKILIDSNIFIPLEITSDGDIEANKDEVDSFYKKCLESGFTVYLHGEIVRDINRDKNDPRRNLRLLATNKYPKLDDVNYSDFVKAKIGLPQTDTHDYVDYHLLNALYCNAVNILVSNDINIYKKAQKLDIEDRVYTLNDVDNLFSNLNNQQVKIPPQVQSEKCYNIDVNDPIFDTLKRDYKDFENWFRTKCQNEHRLCFITRDNKNLSGIAIIKEEEPCCDMTGKILKLCTFKTSQNVSGNKFGEVLLRAIFDYCYQKNYSYLYVTAFESNFVCTFFENFGFEKYYEIKADTGELIYRKLLYPDNTRKLLPLQYHVLFGPKYSSSQSDYFLVPIAPVYHERLFPELEMHQQLFPRNNSFSNGILKAYISKSRIKKIKKGDLLLFYRSEDERTIQARGVIDKINRVSDISDIISLTGKRTAYTLEEIKSTYNESEEILIILFRQANSLNGKIKLSDIGVKSPPQSITQLSAEGKKCVDQIAIQ